MPALRRPLPAAREEMPPAVHPRLVALLTELARGEGYSPSLLPGVKFMRATQPVPRMQVAYEPSIVLVAQGRKRGHLGGQTFTYDANHYLVLALPLPFECDTEATPAEPMLGLSVGITPTLVTELLVELQDALPPPESRPPAMQATALDAGLADAAIRLLETLRSPHEARILGPAIVREMIYRVLRGELSATLRALAAPHTHFGQIGRVLHRMHADFAKAFDMTTLAREAGMSVSTFHTHFKAVTSSSPLQYLKAVRLHKARMLMVHEGANAAFAAMRVGYESASQFNREFKRYFGGTPSAVASQLRTSLLQLA